MNAPRINVLPPALLVFALVLSILGLAYFVYDFSSDGLAFLVGRAAGPFVLLFLISLPWRKSANRLSIILGITLFFFVLASREDLAGAIEFREARPLIAVSQHPDDFQRHAREHPDNRILNFMARALEIRAEQETLWLEIGNSLEPSAIPAVIHVERMDGQELRSLSDAFGRAEQNARAALPEMDAIIADARNRIEIEAKSIPKFADEVLAGFDAEAVRVRPLRMALLQKREEYYRAFRAFAGFLAANYGTYSLSPEGAFQFPDQALTDSFSRLAGRLQTAWDDMAEADGAADRHEKERAGRFARTFSGSEQ